MKDGKGETIDLNEIAMNKILENYQRKEYIIDHKYPVIHKRFIGNWYNPLKTLYI